MAGNFTAANYSDNLLVFGENYRFELQSREIRTAVHSRAPRVLRCKADLSMGVVILKEPRFTKKLLKQKEKMPKPYEIL